MTLLASNYLGGKPNNPIRGARKLYRSLRIFQGFFKFCVSFGLVRVKSARWHARPVALRVRTPRAYTPCAAP